MNEKYAKCRDYWDGVFSKTTAGLPSKKSSGNPVFDSGLSWLCEGTQTVVDFGCGAGTVLFLCAMLGTGRHTGIDLSPSAVEKAVIRAEKMGAGKFEFIKGGIEALEKVLDGSADAFVMSNILDNLYPEDGAKLLSESRRILRKGGKALIKLNAHLPQEQIKKLNIKVINGDLLDDGLILLNRTTEKWKELIEEYFTVVKYEEVPYPEHGQANRMFLVIK